MFARIGTACTAVLLSAILLHAGCINESPSSQLAGEIAFSELPEEAQTTIESIRRGGPFPYTKDGRIFFNREKLLPENPRGYYREYTVPTPGVSHRGARRIVTGKRGELYYTADHYRSFWSIRQ